MSSKFVSMLGLLFSILLTVSMAIADENSDRPAAKGTVKGIVIDNETRTPLIGVSVGLMGTMLGDATDESGRFEIKNVPVGAYSIRFNSIGYAPLSYTDVIVRPKRITHLDAELKPSAVKTRDVNVSGGYFVTTDELPTSSISFSAEEVRRAPGSAGDVSRIVSVLPSVAKVNDQLNNLVVRGGNPIENGFYVDHIEIPNINHYPLQGSTGGPIGLLNVDFIRDVDFSAGGFAATYGDRLSSIMDISFREGNRDEFDGQLDFNFAGFGAVAEGPINQSGSWLVSARRSFLDLIVDAIGTGVAPRYSDYQGKITYELSPRHKLTMLGILGVDDIAFDKDQSIDDGNPIYGDFNGREYALGVNWQSLWHKNGYSVTTLSTLGTKYKANITETKSDIFLSRNNSLEQTYQFRNVNHLRLSRIFKIGVGLDAKYYSNDYDYYGAKYTNGIGDSIPSLTINQLQTSPKYGAYVNFTWDPFPSMTTTFGVRYDYFSFTEKGQPSPRFSFNLNLSEKTSLNGAVGLYYQPLPLMLLAQKDEFKTLETPRSNHYILGVKHLLAQDIQLTLETYYKDYRNYPLDPSQPQLFVADEIAFAHIVGNFEKLSSAGKAYSAGVEMTLQKKLARDIYGLVSGSYSRSRYRDLDGKWRDRIFDNRILFSTEGGYKPEGRSWEFSLRWILGGGAPYTPLDLEKSALINRTVLDADRINDERYPAYHSLNLRFDKRFNFGGSNLIFYLSVWNAYNRENVAAYYWDETEEKADVQYQWSMIPLFGLEYEF